MKRYLSNSICILLSGKAGVGKSTSANYLWSKLATEFIVTIAPFAVGVKDVATQMGWNGRKDDKGRALLQAVGQLGRNYNEDVWVAKTFNTLLTDVFLPDFILVDDWRFPNEEAYSKNKTGFKVYTIRIEAPSREVLKGTPQYDDVSEVSLDHNTFDYTFTNERSKEDLYLTLDSILEDIISKNLYYTKE